MPLGRKAYRPGGSQLLRRHPGPFPASSPGGSCAEAGPGATSSSRTGQEPSRAAPSRCSLGLFSARGATPRYCRLPRRLAGRPGGSPLPLGVPPSLPRGVRASSEVRQEPAALPGCTRGSFPPRREPTAARSARRPPGPLRPPGSREAARGASGSLRMRGPPRPLPLAGGRGRGGGGGGHGRAALARRLPLPVGAAAPGTAGGHRRGRPGAGRGFLPVSAGPGGTGAEAEAEQTGAERAVLVPQGAGARHVLPRLRALPGERLPLRRAAAADMRRAGHLGQVGAAPGTGQPPHPCLLGARPWRPAAGRPPPAGPHLASLPAQLLPHADRRPGHPAGEYGLPAPRGPRPLRAAVSLLPHTRC